MKYEPHGRKDLCDIRRRRSGSWPGRSWVYPNSTGRCTCTKSRHCTTKWSVCGIGEYAPPPPVHAFTVNVGWVSWAAVSDAEVSEGDVVEMQWGDYDGWASNPYRPDHVLTIIRVTVRWSSRGPSF